MWKRRGEVFLGEETLNRDVFLYIITYLDIPAHATIGRMLWSNPRKAVTSRYSSKNLDRIWCFIKRRTPNLDNSLSLSLSLSRSHSSASHQNHIPSFLDPFFHFLNPTLSFHLAINHLKPRSLMAWSLLIKIQYALWTFLCMYGLNHRRVKRRDDVLTLSGFRKLGKITI